MIPIPNLCWITAQWRLSFHLFPHRNRHGRPWSSEVSWHFSGVSRKSLPFNVILVGKHFVFNYMSCCCCCCCCWSNVKKHLLQELLFQMEISLKPNNTTTSGVIFRSQPFGMMNVGCIVAPLFRWKLKLRSASIQEKVTCSCEKVKSS